MPGTRQYGANTFISWHGDPTLRWQILAPPSNLNGNDGTTVNLTWTASPEASQYWIYRSTSGLTGTWTKLTTDPVSGTSYTDSGAPSGSKLYQARALKLTTSASGSYTNLSMGIFKAVN